MEPTVASMLQGSTQAKGSGVSMLQGSTQAKGSGVSMLQGSTQAKGSGVSMLQGSIQAKGSVQLYSARRDDNAGRCVCGGKVVHTEMTMTKKGLKVVRAQNRSGLTHQRATKLPALFQPATGHVDAISIADSFLYTCYRICT